MERLYTTCCGLDVHKATVVACVLHPGADGQTGDETRTFGTTTDALLALGDGLRAAGCTHVAMEATGRVLEAGVRRVTHTRLKVSHLTWSRKAKGTIAWWQSGHRRKRCMAG